MIDGRVFCPINQQPNNTMLKENKEPVTPHDKKLKKARAIEAHAREIFPILLQVSYGAARPAIQALGSDEEKRSAQSMVFDSVSESAILCAERFRATWLKKKGKYLAD